MLATKSNEWGLIISSVADGTQPTTTYGTSVTPGASNAYGSYTSILAGASVTDDAYGLEIVVDNAYVNATDRGMLVTIGFDPAGGTSFGGLGGVTGNEISDLLCSGAYVWYSNAAPAAGHRFYFPVFVKAGTSIGAKAQTNAATAGTVRVSVRAFCKPEHPEYVRAGSFVRTLGANTTTTDGVSITQGTASEGSWTEIGTAADDLWYIETGIGARSATQSANLSHVDVSIGDATNKRVVVRDAFFWAGNDESTAKAGRTSAYATIANGDKVYARAQSSGAISGMSIACYAVGG